MSDPNLNINEAQVALLDAVRDHAQLCAQAERLEERRRSIAAVAAVTDREISAAADRLKKAFETLRQAHVTAANAAPMPFEV
jgi:hypothetical protein